MVLDAKDYREYIGKWHEFFSENKGFMLLRVDCGARPCEKVTAYTDSVCVSVSKEGFMEAASYVTTGDRCLRFPAGKDRMGRPYFNKLLIDRIKMIQNEAGKVIYPPEIKKAV